MDRLLCYLKTCYMDCVGAALLRCSNCISVRVFTNMSDRKDSDSLLMERFTVICKALMVFSIRDQQISIVGGQVIRPGYGKSLECV